MDTETSEEKRMLRKALIGSSIMFIMTSIGHILVYLANKEKDEDEEFNAIADAIADINEDYNPTISRLEMKCEYVSYMLKERFDADAPRVEI